MYYSGLWRELKIGTHVIRTLLIVSLLTIAFPLCLQAEIEIKKKMAEEYRMKGFEAQEKGNLDKALTFYVKAAGMGEPNAAIYNDIGVIYEQMGVNEKAETNYLEAVKIDNGYLPAYSNLAYLYKNRGDFKKAAEYFKKRFQWGNPDDPWTQKAKQELMAMGNRVPQIKRWLMQLDIMDLDREVSQRIHEEFYRKITLSLRHFTQGQSLEKQKKYQEALLQYNQALSLTPGNPKVVKARKNLLLKMTQEDVQKRAEMAMRMLKIGDTVSAKLEFRKILSIIPNEPIQISK